MDATAGALAGPGGGRRRATLRQMVVLGALALLAGAGCRGAGETTDTMIPRGWRGNPWGPQANAARARGELPIIPNNPDMAVWDEWGRRNLRDGDILFRMGDAKACGFFSFSRVSAGIADSHFSHTGIVAIEAEGPVVYDTTTTGPQRQPFPIWVLDTRGGFAVKRPKAEYQGHTRAAVAFCRDVYQRQVPFDFSMKMGDDQLYCIELTERAYETSGLALSRPIRLDQLPRYAEYPWTVRLLKLASSMVPNQQAYIIGNEGVGIWASPALELVYETPLTLPPGVVTNAPPQPPALASRPSGRLESLAGTARQ